MQVEEDLYLYTNSSPYKIDKRLWLTAVYGDIQVNLKYFYYLKNSVSKGNFLDSIVSYWFVNNTVNSNKLIVYFKKESEMLMYKLKYGV